MMLLNKFWGLIGKCICGAFLLRSDGNLLRPRLHTWALGVNPSTVSYVLVFWEIRW